MNKKQRKTRKGDAKPSPHRLNTKDDATMEQYVLLKSSETKNLTPSRKKGKKPTQRKNHLSSEQSLKGKLQLITDALLTLQDIDYVAIWMRKPADSCDQKKLDTKQNKGKKRTPNQGELHLVVSSGHLTHSDENDHRMLPSNQGLIGKVMSHKSQKYHISTINERSLSHVDGWIQQEGFVSFTGYRLRSVEKKPSGVFAVFGNRSLTSTEESFLKLAVAATQYILLPDVPVSELVETRELFNALYNRSLFWVFRHDFDGNLIAANKTLLDEMGFTEQEIPHININTLRS